jgi:predicted permease
MLNKLFESVGFARGVQYTGCVVTGLMILALILVRPKGGVRQSKDQAPVAIKSFFKEPPYLLMITGVFLVALGLFFPIFFIQVSPLLSKLSLWAQADTLRYLRNRPAHPLH